MSRIEINNDQTQILKSRIELLCTTVHHIMKLAKKELGGNFITDIAVEGENQFTIQDVRVTFPVRGIIAESISDKKKVLELKDVPYSYFDADPMTAPIVPQGIEGPIITHEDTGRKVQFYYYKLLAGQVEGVVTEKDNRVMGYFNNLKAMVAVLQKEFRPKPEPKKVEKKKFVPQATKPVTKKTSSVNFITK